MHLLGEVASRREPLDSAAAAGHYRSATTLAADLGMRPLVARCHLGRGARRRRSGGADDAEPDLTRALSMFVEMEMPFWSEKANAAIRGVGNNLAAQ